jgi:hypothetical protein
MCDFSNHADSKVTFLAEMSDYSTHWKLDIRSVSCEKLYFEGVRCFFADGLFGVRGAAFDYSGIVETYSINLKDNAVFKDDSEFIGLYLNTT